VTDKPEKLEQLFTVSQTAEALSVTNGTIYRFLISGRLKGVKIGGSQRWRIRSQDVQDFLKRYTVKK